MKKIISLFAFQAVLIASYALSAYAYSESLFRGMYLPIGLSTGISSIDGLDIGAEISLVNFDRFIGTSIANITGVYCDYLLTDNTRRMSAGIEYGIVPVIFDAGYLRFTEDGTTRHGFVVRMTIVAVVLPYIRYGKIYGEGDTNFFIEAGMLLKLPLPLF